MSFKPLLLHYVLNSILMSLKLAPITPASGVKFMRRDSYSPLLKTQTSMHTDVVITNSSIEVHNYSPDPREKHIFSIHSSTKQFLSAFIKQRAYWAVVNQVGLSSATIELIKQGDHEILKNAATELGNERSKLTDQYHFTLEKKLNGIFVKIVSLIIGF